MNAAFRRITYVIAVVIVGAYVIIALRGPQGVPALMDKRRQIRSLQEENANLAREIELKQKRIHRLQENKSEQEKQIRQDYHLQRQGDVTLMLPEASENKPKSQPFPGGSQPSAPGAAAQAP
jgi:cell division protein FtsB